ncbi:MAG: hypothetical protein JXD21_06055 [Candidatus Omnitrophica bacterium]|nr:hypothetical protein [Candidatus Omnitrophota bacterium]
MNISPEKIKKWIISQGVIRKVIFYEKDLCEGCLSGSSEDTENKDIAFMFYGKLPPELLSVLDSKMNDHVGSDPSGVVVFYRGIPAGCFLFDLTGQAFLRVPFSWSLPLKRDQVYGYGLYVKKPFRGKGFARELYRESFCLLKKTKKQLTVFVDKDNFIANKLVVNLGFKKVNDIALVKLCGWKQVIIMDSVSRRCLFFLISALLAFLRSSVSASISISGELFNRISRFLKKRSWKIFIVRAYGSMDQTEVAVICRNKPDRSLLYRIFPGGQEILCEKNILNRTLIREIKRLSRRVDMIFIDSTLRHLRRKVAALENIRFMPQWVAQKTTAFTQLDSFRKIRQNKNRSAYYDIKAVEKRGFEYEFTKNPGLFDFFYRQMYLPYMDTRHGENKVIPPLRMIRKGFRRGGLFFVKKNGRYLAGAVVELQRAVFHPMFIGVLNGDISLTKKHVVTALYYFYFKFTQEHNYRMIDFGLSRAFLNDGTLRYKNKWNAYVEYDPKRCNSYAFLINRYSQPVKQFLLKNPFISIEKDGLVGNVFYDATENISQEKMSHHYSMPGLSRLDICGLNMKIDVIQDAAGGLSQNNSEQQKVSI